MRLTKHFNKEHNKYFAQAGDYVFAREQIINKLGKLEDIEDELGINLITLFKAMKEGFIDDKANHYEPFSFSIDLESSCIREACEEYGEGVVFYLSDYGKTWALDKEDFNDNHFKLQIVKEIENCISAIKELIIPTLNGPDEFYRGCLFTFQTLLDKINGKEEFVCKL